MQKALGAPKRAKGREVSNGGEQQGQSSSQAGARQGNQQAQAKKQKKTKGNRRGGKERSGPTFTSGAGFRVCYVD